jgi:hypothetical protein
MAIARGIYGGGQIKGSISGTTYQQSPFGTVLRNRTVPVNPNSPKQVSIRASLGALSYLWTTLLSAAQRQGWEDYAAATPIVDRFGSTIIVRGRQMYMRTNMILLYVTGSPISDAPSTPGVGPATLLDITGDTTDGIVLNTNPGVSVVGDLCSLGISVPVNQSRNFYKAPFTFAASVISTTTFPFEIKPAAEVVIGQRYFVSARLVQANGKVSYLTIAQVDILA